MSNAAAGLVGALIGGLAAIAGAYLQARTAARTAQQQRQADERKALEERETQAAERRQLLARRYLFGLQDAAESLRRRLENWAVRGGQSLADATDPGYWSITTLYAVGRALACERILALEAVYPALEADLPQLVEYFKDHGVEVALANAVGDRMFRYHRLALAEATLERDADEFRVLTYSEFRQRYEDPKWGLNRLLEPATTALSRLSRPEMSELERSLSEIVRRLEAVTKVPRKKFSPRIALPG
jgi:hypothetical protein